MTDREYSSFTDEEREQMATSLKKDFLDRDEGTFVKIRQSGRSGWERMLPEGSPYSAYMTSDPDRLIRNAYRHACDMVAAMNVPQKVRVMITPRKNATDSRTVWVATEVFDDTEMSAGQKVDCFTGATIHECAHLLYTDFNSPASSSDMLTHDLENIIEDERIERILGEEKPGMAQFIKTVKYYYFGRYALKRDELEREQGSLPLLARAVNAILAVVRYPSAASEESLKDFAPMLIDVRETLTPFPRTTAETSDAAIRIRELLQKLFEEEEKKQEEKEQNRQDEEKSENKDKQEGNGQEQSEAGQNSESKEPAGTGNDNPTEGGEDRNEESREEDGDAGQDKPSSSGSTEQRDNHECGGAVSQSSEKAAQRIELEAEMIRDILEELSSEPQDGSNRPPKDIEMKMASQVADDNCLVGLECEGDLERGRTEDTILIRTTENREAYRRSAERVRKYVPAMAKALKCNGSDHNRTLRGLRNGKLDTGRLAEAYQSVQTVYTRCTTRRSDNISICVLIDESGSMRGVPEAAARDTAVLFKEALENVKNINLSIYGFTGANDKACLYPYIENGRGARHALGSTSSRGLTPTAHAIREATARTKTEGKGLLMVISDGMPDTGPAPVKKAADDAARKGFRTIGVSISPALSEQELKQMYGENITVTDLSQLAPVLGKLLKKHIMKDTGHKTA